MDAPGVVAHPRWLDGHGSVAVVEQGQGKDKRPTKTRRGSRGLPSPEHLSDIDREPQPDQETLRVHPPIYFSYLQSSVWRNQEQVLHEHLSHD